MFIDTLLSTDDMRTGVMFRDRADLRLVAVVVLICKRLDR